MLWKRFDMMPLTSGRQRSMSRQARAGLRQTRLRADAAFDNRDRMANLERIMPFDATLYRGLLRAGNLIAGN